MMNGIIFMGKVNMITLPMLFIITLLDLIHHHMGKVQSKTDDNSECQEIIFSLRQTKTGHGMPLCDNAIVSRTLHVYRNEAIHIEGLSGSGTYTNKDGEVLVCELGGGLLYYRQLSRNQ